MPGHISENLTTLKSILCFRTINTYSKIGFIKIHMGRIVIYNYALVYLPINRV